MATAGCPRETRTPDRQLRKLPLYPTELWGRCVTSENHTAYVYWRPRCVAELYCLGLVRNEIAARNCGVTSENWIPMPEFGRT